MADQVSAAPATVVAKAENGAASGLPWVEVDGILFPKKFEEGLNQPMREHIDCVRAMNMREDDILLCAYPKTGTHWLWEISSMLLAGSAECEKRTKEHVMIEMTPIEKLQALLSPRLLNTHFPISMLPNQVKVGKKVKIIHVYRNPKDVLVSMFYHSHVMRWGMTLDMMISMFLSEQFTETKIMKILTDVPNLRITQCAGVFGTYFSYLKNMDRFLKDNPDIPVCNISFEDTKENPKKTVQRLAQFLQVEASEELCESIAEACSFDRMKEADKSKDKPELMHELQPQLYRKGEVGDWKNHLTVAVSEAIDRAMEELQGCDFRFRFTL